MLLLVINNDNKGKEPIQVFNRAKQSGTPFEVPRSLSKYPVIFSTELLNKEDMTSLEATMRQRRIARQWNYFVNETLPLLNRAVRTRFTV